jgi:hypothetical protein
MLHCVVAVFGLDKLRAKLANEFITNFNYPGTKLHVIELAYGDAPFTIYQSNNQLIQLRTEIMLWHKENLINVMISKLPSDWKYVAWLDSDIIFENTNWAIKTIEMLDQTECIVCQPYSYVVEQSNNGVTITESLISRIKNKSDRVYHTGYAWACNRQAYEQMGGLYEYNIVGSGDLDMAMAFIGKSESLIDNFEQRTTNFKTEYVIGVVTTVHNSPGNYIKMRSLLIDFDRGYLKNDEDGILIPTAEMPEKMIKLISDYFLQRSSSNN